MIPVPKFQPGFVPIDGSVLNTAFNTVSTNSRITAIAATGRLQIIGTRCGINGAAGFQEPIADAGYLSRMKHYLPNGAKSISLVYAGFKVTNAIEASALPGANFLATSAVVGNSGGTSYVVGDIITPTVATNNVAPQLVVMAISGGVVTQLGVLAGSSGMFYQYPAANLATTGGTGTNLTVTLTVTPVLLAHVGLEQSWGNQLAYASPSNQTGVLQLTSGPGYFGPNSNIAIPFGGFTVTDPVGVNLSPKSAIGSRFWTNGIIPSQAILSGTDGNFPLSEYAFYSTETDDSWDGIYPTDITSNLGTGVNPLAIMGTLSTPSPSFICIGDSIVQGVVSIPGPSQTNDTFDQYGGIGWFSKAINIQLPWMTFASSGDLTANWITAAMNDRMRFIAYAIPSHLLDELAINDFVTGITYPQFLANKIAFWGKLIGLGVKEIWITTCTPNSTSSDGFTTLSGQTPSAANVGLQQYNAAARSGAFAKYGVTKVLDICSYVESSQGSGKWKVGATFDGTHPTSTIIPSIVAGVTSQFSTATL